MKRTFITVCALVALFVSFVGGQQTDGQGVLGMFLSRKQVPVTESVTVRRLSARALKSSASMEVETRRDGQTFSYRVLREEGSGFIRDKVMRTILDGEKKLIEQGGSESLGFSEDNYRFGEVERAEGGLWKTKAFPLRKEGLLSESILFFDDASNLVRSMGKLPKKPHPLVLNARTEVTYGYVLGIRVPMHLQTTSKVLLVVIPTNATLDMDYIYRSLNGAEVEEIK